MQSTYTWCYLFEGDKFKLSGHAMEMQHLHFSYQDVPGHYTAIANHEVIMWRKE